MGRAIKLDGLEVRRQIGADPLEVIGGDLFHLDLHSAIARIDVIELLLPALAAVGFNLAVDEFGHANDRSASRRGQAEIVEPGEFIVRTVEMLRRDFFNASAPNITTEPKLKSSRMLPS